MGNELPLLHAGKVRRLYAWPSLPGEAGRLLLVATDNISAYDFVLDSQIPDKGKVLTQLSIWWFEQLKDLVANHFISADVPPEFEGRAMITEELDMIPVECVARGYLTGSGWAEYQESGSVCGIPLPPGLQDGSRLPEPIFTPAIKAAVGEHDENVDFETIVQLHGPLLAETLKKLTLSLYARAEEIACERGIILADTKFEFGARRDGTIVLADEVLTPDSSRFWEAATWQPGGSQPSFDKQYVRDWLAKESGWDKNSNMPPPALPESVITATRNRYLEAYERLVGQPMPGFASVLTSTGLKAKAHIGHEPHNFDCAGIPQQNPDLADEKIEAAVTQAVVTAGFTPIPKADLAERDNISMTTENNLQAGAQGGSFVTAHKIIVEVMPKPEILDPQGKAITGALARLGFTGLSVRQGKRFEISVAEEITEELLNRVRQAAETLLANTVVESFEVRVEK